MCSASNRMNELFRSLLRLWGDEPPPVKDPPDGGHGRGRPLALGQVVGDGVGPSVQTLVGQELAQLEDLLL
jgi:hypothetical protein